MTTATEAIDKLHSTAESHDRVMVVEVMGRNCGWIALSAGIAGSADVILIPEIPFRLESVCEKIMAREAAGRHFSIVVCAEGARPEGGELTFQESAQEGQRGPAGGRRREGHLGDPGPHRQGDARPRARPPPARRHAHRLRPFALDPLRRGRRAPAGEGKWGNMVAFDPPDVVPVPLEAAVASVKQVPVDGDIVRSARDLGVSFGD